MKKHIKLTIFAITSLFATLSNAAYDPNMNPGSFLQVFQYQKNSTELYSCAIPKKMFGMTIWFTSCNRSGTGWSCTLGAGSSGFSGNITTPHNYESYMSTSSGMALCDQIPQDPPKPPDPPVIIDNPCPSGSSSMNAGGRKMADSTSVGGSLCSQSLTIGFDANGLANSLITEHSTTSTQSISAATSFVNAVRKGGADSTTISGGLPTTANYSDATLTTNSNGQTQISNVSSGVQTLR